MSVVYFLILVYCTIIGMESVYSNKSLRQKMAVKARVRFERTFELDLMVESYRQLMINVAPPVILLDMDGVLVDWDKGFMQVSDASSLRVLKNFSLHMHQDTLICCLLILTAYCFRELY